MTVKTTTQDLWSILYRNVDPCKVKAKKLVYQTYINLITKKAIGMENSVNDLQKLIAMTGNGHIV